MEKIKLTPAQIDAINKALSHYGDADYLVKMHQNVINNGHEWSQWNALNELSVTTLSHALKYGFEMDEQALAQSSTKTEEYRGIKIKVLKGDYKGKVLPITFMRHDGELFGLGDEIFLKTSDRGKWWEFAEQQPQVETSTKQELELDLDYQLASLHDAMLQGDQAEVERSKKRLAEIHRELEGIK